MEQVASLEFRDVEAGSRAFAAVRAAREVVALALSLETEGDLEVCVTPKVARELAAAWRSQPNERRQSEVRALVA